MSAGLIAWCFQPWVRFGSSFSHSWLNAPWTMTDLGLSDQYEQPLVVLRHA
jgi:hypothetical protein